MADGEINRNGATIRIDDDGGVQVEPAPGQEVEYTAPDLGTEAIRESVNTESLESTKTRPGRFVERQEFSNEESIDTTVDGILNANNFILFNLIQFRVRGTGTAELRLEFRGGLETYLLFERGGTFKYVEDDDSILIANADSDNHEFNGIVEIDNRQARPTLSSTVFLRRDINSGSWESLDRGGVAGPTNDDLRVFTTNEGEDPEISLEFEVREVQT